MISAGGSSFLEACLGLELGLQVLTYQYSYSTFLRKRAALKRWSHTTYSPQIVMTSGVCYFCSICLRYPLRKSDITCNIWSSSAYINLSWARSITSSSTSPILCFPKTDAKPTMCCRWSFQKKLEDSRWLIFLRTTTTHRYVSVPALRTITKKNSISFKTQHGRSHVLSTRPTPKFPPKFITRDRMCRVVQPKNTAGPVNVCLLAVSKKRAQDCTCLWATRTK